MASVVSDYNSANGKGKNKEAYLVSGDIYRITHECISRARPGRRAKAKVQQLLWDTHEVRGVVEEDLLDSSVSLNKLQYLTF